MSKEILVEQDGPVLRVTLNRPDTGNGMSDDNAIEFASVINRAHETSDLVLLRANGKDFIEIKVADRGHGVLVESTEKLFAPFYTTKPEGMGMGLNICRSIIEFHHGRLWAFAHAGGGAVFSFTLPAYTR